MKLTSTAKVTILAKEKKDATGEYGESFKMAIMQGSECGTLSCTKDAFYGVEDINLMKPHVIEVTTSEYQNKITRRITAVMGLAK